jgi:predicted nucleotidyltransferase
MMNEAVAVDELPVAERIPVSQEQIETFCRKWNIRQFALFGSVLREDFRRESDVDVLVVFAPDARFTLFDFVAMQEELSVMFGRKVDLVEKAAVKNPFVRHHIRNNHQIVFNAA